MPYQSTADVPSYVPAEKRAQWMEIFNSCMANGDTEAEAFRKANGGINARKEIIDALFGAPAAQIIAGNEPLSMKNAMQSLPIVGSLFGDGDSISPAITLFKSSDDKLRFFCRPSNCFRDRHDEILTSAAHKEYAEWVSNTGLYPELQIWHTPAAKVGQVEWVDYADDFLCASGVIYPQYESQVTRAVQQGAGMSHGFIPVYDSVDQRDIRAYRSFEFTILPVTYAANMITDINLLQWSEKEMGFTPAKRKYFTDLGFSEDQITAFENSTKQMAERVRALGIEHKDINDTDESASLMPQIAALTEAMTAMTGTLSTVISNQQAQQKAIDEAKELATAANKSVDDRVAEQLTPRSNPNAAGYVASQAQDNVNQAASAAFKAGDSGVDFLTLIGQQAMGQMGLAVTPPAVVAPAAPPSTNGTN